MEIKKIDYAQLDRKISETFSLPCGCVFVLSVHRDGRSLEYAYPAQLKGNIFPLDNKTIAGHSAAARRPYISNKFQEEKGFVLLNWLMSKGGVPVQKAITYPIVFTDKVIAVIQVTRRGSTPPESGPDFQKEDLEKIKSVLDDFLAPHTLKSAQGE